MVESSREIIALSTMEKLGTAEAYYVCPTNQLTTIITDQPDNLNAFEIYKSMGIRMV